MKLKYRKIKSDFGNFLEIKINILELDKKNISKFKIKNFFINFFVNYLLYM